MKQRKNLYTLSLEEVNGNFRITNAEKLSPVNQYRSVLKRTNARSLSRAIKRGKLVVN